MITSLDQFLRSWGLKLEVIENPPKNFVAGFIGGVHCSRAAPSAHLAVEFFMEEIAGKDIDIKGVTVGVPIGLQPPTETELGLKLLERPPWARTREDVEIEDPEPRPRRSFAGLINAFFGKGSLRDYVGYFRTRP